MLIILALIKSALNTIVHGAGKTLSSLASFCDFFSSVVPTPDFRVTFLILTG